MAGKPVLVVDDEREIRRLMAAILSQQKFQVIESPDGLSAFTTLQKLNGEVCLLVSDVRMPGCSGVVLTQRVKDEYPSIPVLLISGDADQDDRSCGDGFLDKPFTGERFFQVVQSLVSAGPRKKGSTSHMNPLRAY